ncbi:hypothetical protein HanIR_Chr02g0091121 [Helianthus annuus]|nr:hypothetical protein HanIR_Chr02g0091121 [Helianthus annuus]
MGLTLTVCYGIGCVIHFNFTTTHILFGFFLFFFFFFFVEFTCIFSCLIVIFLYIFLYTSVAK